MSASYERIVVSKNEADDILVPYRALNEDEAHLVMRILDALTFQRDFYENSETLVEDLYEFLDERWIVNRTKYGFSGMEEVRPKVIVDHKK